MIALILIARAIHNLHGTLGEELLIVSLVSFCFFFGTFLQPLIPIITIPITVLLSFIPLYLTGQTTNIMSLAGIAISIGVLVDGAIIQVENTYKKFRKWKNSGRKELILCLYRIIKRS